MKRYGKIGLLFTTPALIFFLTFLAVPIIISIYFSFTEWTGLNLNQIKFIGIGNYIEVFTDPIFHKALFNTFIYVFLKVLFQFLIGLLIALIIDAKVHGSKFLQTIIFIPVLISPIIIGVMWSRMFSAFGILNKMLMSLNIIKMPIMWLGEPNIALYTIVVATLWQYTGFNTLLFYAGLQGIPRELIEAGQVDGASYFTIVKNIIIPMLKPVIAITVLWNMMAGFKVFDLVWVMTVGGPNHSSEVLATRLYDIAFNYNKMGPASVIAFVIVILCVITATVRSRLLRD